jgi:hypothetical protein
MIIKKKNMFNLLTSSAKDIIKSMNLEKKMQMFKKLENDIKNKNINN